MPWEIADVEKHKKGLGDKEKEVWVKVANSALKRCQDKGSSDCEGSAIRQANSVVAKNMSYEDFEIFSTSEHEYIIPHCDEQGLGLEIDKFMKKFKQTQTFNIKGVEIFAVGEWNGDDYTKKDLNDMVAAYSEVGFEPPLKLGHNKKQEPEDGKPAYGWIDRIYTKGSILLADFHELPLKVYEALKRKNYKTVSSEIFWDYNQNGKNHRRVLKAVSLLGADIPAVTDLESIGNLYGDKVGDYHIHEINFTEVIDMEAKEYTEKIEKLEKSNDTLKTQNKELSDENQTLTDDNEKSKTQLAEQQAGERASQIKVFIDTKKKEGKVLPKHEKELEALLLSCSDEKVYTQKDGNKTTEMTQRELVESIVNGLPKMVDYSEAKDGKVIEGDDSYTNVEEAGVEVDKRVKELMNKDSNIKSYNEAMDKVLASDPELKTAYIGR